MDISIPRHFSINAVWQQKTGAEVSGHFGTNSLVPNCLIVSHLKLVPNCLCALTRIRQRKTTRVVKIVLIILFKPEVNIVHDC